MDFVVRRTRADEWPLFRRLRLEALQDSPTAYIEQYAESVAEGDDFWIERAARAATAAQTAMFAAYAPDGDDPDRRMIAKASAYLEPDTARRTAHVVGVYATPSARGTGAAGAVVTAAVDWAVASLRPAVVHLYVTEGNDRAAAFYRRLGFAATGDTFAHPHHPDLVEHEMVLVGRRRE